MIQMIFNVQLMIHLGLIDVYFVRIIGEKAMRKAIAGIPVLVPLSY